MNWTPPPSLDPPPKPQPSPKRFERSGADRLIAGVCGGIGKYFGIDATLVRIAMVGLVLVGGAGLVLYAAAVLLVPQDGEQPAHPPGERDRLKAVLLVMALVIAGLVIGGFGLFLGGALVPIAVLVLIGLAVSWVISGERPGGSTRDVLRRTAQGLGVLAGCFVLSVASFLAAGLGGGAIVAGLVVVVGVALVAAAFVGGARWLVLPALAVAVPLAFVSAAGLDLDGGFGDRHVRPATVGELDGSYRLGAGELVVDLRDLELPPGDRRLSLAIGAGHVLLLVGEDVCVASSADIGMGGVTVFERDGGGVDVQWSDSRRASADTPRLIVDADIGLGYLEVRHRRIEHDGPRWRDRDDDVNAACVAGARA